MSPRQKSKKISSIKDPSTKIYNNAIQYGPTYKIPNYYHALQLLIIKNLQKFIYYEPFSKNLMFFIYYVFLTKALRKFIYYGSFANTPK